MDHRLHIRRPTLRRTDVAFKIKQYDLNVIHVKKKKINDLSYEIDALPVKIHYSIPNLTYYQILK